MLLIALLFQLPIAASTGDIPQIEQAVENTFRNNYGVINAIVRNVARGDAAGPKLIKSEMLT